MKIPEPATRGWTDVLGCVDEVFRTREGRRGWSLHGGTLLAMRWDGHRESTDIDLLIGADAGRGEGEGGGGDGKRPAGRTDDGGYGESGQRTEGEGRTPSGRTEEGGRVMQEDMAG